RARATLAAPSPRSSDLEPRPGKVGGAFCMGTKDGKSAILSNFTPSFDGVSTMAHELGHAYHNVCEKDRTVLQRTGTPMTLAETEIGRAHGSTPVTCRYP